MSVLIERIRRLKAEQPDLWNAEIARRLGCTHSTV
jgi:hypothetical protein